MENDPSVIRPSATPASQCSFWHWLQEIAVSVAISVFIVVFLYQPVRVEGTSMMPALVDQERIFINKFVYRFEQVERGDVVVFRYPNDPSKSYIKRVIAGPGDQVAIAGGVVLLNGQRLVEPYVPANYRDRRSMAEIMVPEGKVFVLGDHRNLSSDSRDFGPVEKSAIYGKAVFAYWPVTQAGKLH